MGEGQPPFVPLETARKHQVLFLMSHQNNITSARSLANSRANGVPGYEIPELYSMVEEDPNHRIKRYTLGALSEDGQLTPSHSMDPTDEASEFDIRGFYFTHTTNRLPGVLFECFSADIEDGRLDSELLKRFAGRPFEKNGVSDCFLNPQEAFDTGIRAVQTGFSSFIDLSNPRNPTIESIVPFYRTLMMEDATADEEFETRISPCGWTIITRREPILVA